MEYVKKMRRIIDFFGLNLTDAARLVQLNPMRVYRWLSGAKSTIPIKSKDRIDCLMELSQQIPMSKGRQFGLLAGYLASINLTLEMSEEDALNAVALIYRILDGEEKTRQRRKKVEEAPKVTRMDRTDVNLFQQYTRRKLI